MRLHRVAIFSLEDDLHALLVQDVLASYGDVSCEIVETTRVCNSGALSWANQDPAEFACSLPEKDGGLVDIRLLDLIWLRRINYPQLVPTSIVDPIQVEIINNDCRASILGLIASEFSGKWINEPFASYRAENKILQLKTAKEVGLRTPRTIVSQDPDYIRKFCESLDYNVVLKTVKGSSKHPLFTVRVTEDFLKNDESIRLSPAIYQELIPGDYHMRVHCFGEDVHAFSVESAELDWRGNIDVPIQPAQIDAEVVDKLQHVLRTLGLRMGVFDLKRDADGAMVWLEVNPQGQFLFMEGLTGERLSVAFAEFLYKELGPDTT